MILKHLLACIAVLAFQVATAQHTKVYFNNPVDVTVATEVPATYLNHTLDDTLVAYISRAHSTIDIAVYNYIQSSGMANIANAINQAHDNGVVIRWICNGSSSNSGLSLLNSAIPTVASPTSNNYGIMHNKFMVIDAGSSNPNEPIVWTGSCNWDGGQFDDDVNNTVIVQNAAMAQAYTTEFNEMWGSSGLVPNTGLSRFGPYKTNNTPHSFIVDGHAVEVYFSPSDGTNAHIVSALHSANDDLYFGVYTFTQTQEADTIVHKANVQNVHTAGIIDSYSTSFNAYPILYPALGARLKVYNQSGAIYHSKMLIADPCSPASDPLVETGSHNWTVAAETKNDENTLILHDDTIANLYYQSFRQNFLDLGGTLSPCVFTGVEDLRIGSLRMGPLPADASFTLWMDEPRATVTLLTSGGAIAGTWSLHGGANAIDTRALAPGLYALRVQAGNSAWNERVVVVHE